MKKGYTLIEILVVLVIMGILFAVGYANYRDFARQQLVISAMRALRADLRLAQEQAIEGKKPTGCTGVLNGYKFTVTSSTSYQISAACTSDVVVKTVNTPSNINIDTPNLNPIVFNVLGTGTNINQAAPSRVVIGLTQATTNYFRSVIVYPSGEIKESTETPDATATPTPTPSPTPTPIPPAIAWWRFDESSGSTASDSTGNGHTATWNGYLGNQWTTGKAGNAGNFNGANYLTTASMTPYNVSRSVSFWFYPTSSGVQRGIVSVGNNPFDTIPLWLLVELYSNNLSLYHGGNYRTGGSPALTTNTWYFGTYTFDASTNIVRLYLNTILEYEGMVADANYNNSTLYIGIGYNNYFQGKIDDLRIFNYALNSSQISYLYNNPGQP